MPWLKEGESYAMSGGGWLVAGQAYEMPGSWFPAEEQPPEPADTTLADQQALVEARMRATEQSLATVDQDNWFPADDREELQNRMSRLREQRSQLAEGIPLTPLEGSGLEGQFDMPWEDGGPAYLQDLNQRDRTRFVSALEQARAGVPETAFGRTLSRIGSGVSSSVRQAYNRSQADYVGARDAYLEEAATQQAIGEQSSGRVENIVAGVGESLAKAVPAGLAGGVPGVIAAVGADTLQNAIERGRSQGLTSDESRVYALVSAGIEVGVTSLFSAFGRGGVERLIGGNALAKPVASMVGGLSRKQPSIVADIGNELLEEEIIAQMQYAVDAGTFDGDWSASEAAEIAVDTAAATVLSVGVMRTTDPKFRRAVGRFVENPSRTNASAIGLGYLGTKRQRDRVADGLKTQQLRRELHGLVGRNLQSVEEADFMFHMLEARAQSAGVNLDQYLEKTGLKVRQGKWDEYVIAQQMQGPAAPTEAPVETQRPAALPPDLAGAKPRYSYGSKRFELQFESDIDKAAYIAAQDKRSKRDADYIAFVTDAAAMTEADVRNHGRRVRQYIKGVAKVQDAGSLNIPTQLAEQPTPAYQLPDGAKQGKDGKYRVKGKLIKQPPAGWTEGEQTPAPGMLFEPTEAPTPKRGRSRARIDLREDGNAVITAFESADLVSLVHELGHLFRRDLAGKDMQVAARWAGAKNGQWTTEAEEKFADGFQKWVAEGKGPTTTLDRFFSRFANYLVGLYDAHRKSRLEPLELSPAIRVVFEQLLSPQRPRKGAGEQANQPTPTEAPPPYRPPAAPVEGLPAAPVESSPAAPVESSPASPVQAVLADSEDPVTLRFRGLANHAATEGARRMNFAADVEMGDPGVRKWADATAEATARIAADPAGRQAYWLGEIAKADRTGGTIDLTDMADTVELSLLRNAVAEEAFATRDPDRILLHTRLNRAFREARTEAARSLGYRDPIEGPQGRIRRAIQNALTADTPDIAERRRAAKTPADHEALDREVVDRMRRIADYLDAKGIDVSDLDAIINDPDVAADVIAIAAPRQRGFMDMLFEYWRNSILSGPTTHGVNATSNLLFFSWNQLERVSESLYNIGSKNNKLESATFGEMPYVLRAIFSGSTWSTAMSNAIRAFRTESSVLEEQLAAESRNRLDGPQFAIYGDPTKLPGRVLNRAGRLIRTMGYRPLLFMDEFAKTIATHTEVGAYAYRIAKIEQQKNPSLDVAARVNQLVENRESDAWTMALDRAQTLAFQGRKGIIAEGTSAAITGLRKMPGGRWLLPFRDTPSAVFEEGVRRLPVLGFLLDFAEQRRAGKSIAEIDFAPSVARQAIAFGAMFMVEGLIGDNEDEPFITGTRDINDPRQRDVAYRTFQPQSINVGGLRVSYARYEPIATALAWSVDVINALKQGNRIDGAGTGAAAAGLESGYGLVRQIGTKTFLDTVGDLQDAMRELGQQDARPIATWAAKQAASFVPNFYRSVFLRGNKIPQARVWGKGEHFTSMLARRTAQQALGSPLGYPPTRRFDVWGRSLTYSSEGVGAFWRTLTNTVGSRIRSPEDVLDIDRALYAYNMRHPDQAMSFNEPAKTFAYRGKTHYLTDDEYAEYAQLAGERAFRIASRLPINVDNPTARQVERIGDAVRRGQEIARNQLRRNWLARIRQTTPAPE